MADDKKTIIVVRRARPSRNRNQSGGSWKVAYADFVTAMMAFFMVMWIMGLDPGVKDLIEGYFSNPVGIERSFSGGANIISAGNSPVHTEMKRLALLAREHQRRRFERARDGIQERMASNDELRGLEAQVEIIIADDGLRIELIEANDGETFFAFASAELKPAARNVLGIIAKELEALHNDVMLEGHTDAAQYGSRRYTNWELSVDRANAARRAMEQDGIDGSRILEVRGYAERELRVPDDPRDPANRRVSILLPFQEPSTLQIRTLTPTETAD